MLNNAFKAALDFIFPPRIKMSDLHMKNPPPPPPFKREKGIFITAEEANKNALAEGPEVKRHQEEFYKQIFGEVMFDIKQVSERGERCLYIAIYKSSGAFEHLTSTLESMGYTFSRSKGSDGEVCEKGFVEW